MIPALKKKVLYCILIISFLVLGSLASLIISSRSGNGSYTAYIYQDGRLLHCIPLSKITTELKITHQNGGYNIIQIKDNTIGITEANCPDQICVHQGFITNSLLPITCLPHRLVIELKPDNSLTNEDTVPDAVTH